MNMRDTSYQSSASVMFSDKGSTYFGILLIFLMISLSTTFFVLRFQKKLPTRHRELKMKKPLYKAAFIRRHGATFLKLKSKHFLLLRYPNKLAHKNIKRVQLHEAKK